MSVPDALCLSINTELHQRHYQCAAMLPLSSGMVGVFGPSGAGKTTILQCIAGLIPIQKSAVRCITTATDEIDYEAQDAIVYQAQQPYLFAHLTVEQHLQLMLQHGQFPTLLPLNEVIECCEIEPILKQSVTTLSGGEQQRVALARTLLCGKPIILLDEPFSAIDQKMRYRILQKLNHLQQQHRMRFIIVSHSFTELASICHCIMTIDNGLLGAIGAPHELLQNPHITNNVTPTAYLPLVCHSNDIDANLSTWQLLDKDKTLNADAIQFCFAEEGVHAVNATILWCIPSNAISLSLHKLTHSSHLNQIKGRITQIDDHQHQAIIHILVDEHILYAELHSLAKTALNLALKQEVWLQLPNTLTRFT